jgi:hypothetical protein
MSISYRRLDSSWDYTFGDGKNNFLTDLYAVAQAIRTRLLLFQGEWWENLLDGTPMFQSILGASGSKKTEIDRIIQKRIQETPGVLKVSALSSTFENREYSFIAYVDTDYGTLAVSNQGGA